MQRVSTAIFAITLCSLGHSQTPSPGRLAPDQIPSADNFERWLEFIRPNEDERGYEKIGWRNSFWPAVQEARELGRPILLWTMNGHPLGCT